jgi:precorrin-6A/cobalt-precorrin-6A reductase
MASLGDTSPTFSGSRPTSIAEAKGKVLILGGTAEARELANLLHEAGLRSVTSLAGVTSEPREISGETRIGGFGGGDGLAAFLSAERFSAVVDAAHPFAVAISRHAKQAAERCNMPLVRLERPAWQVEPGDRWTKVQDIAAAVAAIPPGARVLLTIGRKEILPFLVRKDISGIARMIEPVNGKVDRNWHILLARPPFHVEKELCLIEEHRITHVVTKNSGGEETRAKLAAARLKGIEVIMIARPAKPVVPTVGDPLAAVAFLKEVVSA